MSCMFSVSSNNSAASIGLFILLPRTSRDNTSDELCPAALPPAVKQNGNTTNLVEEKLFDTLHLYLCADNHIDTKGSFPTKLIVTFGMSTSIKVLFSQRFGNGFIESFRRSGSRIPNTINSSHLYGLTKFQDISRIPPRFQVFFSLFLK